MYICACYMYIKHVSVCSYILMVPFDSEDLKGIVYVWVGSKADHSEAQIAEEIAYKMYKVQTMKIVIKLATVVMIMVISTTSTMHCNHNTVQRKQRLLLVKSVKVSFLGEGMG